MEYGVEDFVMDDSFQNYCLGKDDQDALFWKAWINDNPQKIETVRQAKKILLLLNGNNDSRSYRRDFQKFKDRFYKHLQKGKDEAVVDISEEFLINKPGNKKRLLFIYAGSIAACFLLMLVLFYQQGPQPESLAKEFVSNPKLIYSSLPGERKSFQLADGSVVTLNGGSRLEVSKDFNLAKREISLKGEAYFSVTHNALKPFIIHTDNINVKVLGTEFDVKAYPGDRTTETILIKGSVEVTVHDRPEEKIVLKPRHKLIIQNEGIAAKDISDTVLKAHKAIREKLQVQNVMLSSTDSSVIETSWKDNRLTFNNETLAEVAVKLERWYGIQVSVAGDIADKYHYTAIFENESLNETLKALQLSLFFHYRIEDDKVLITK
jgi:ferric-dicitrate binding protein FerR (iron transport regulator)